MPARILVVEDEWDVRPVIEGILVGEGYVVDVAATYAHACALIEMGSYDLVVADGVLPDGSGIAVADRAAGRGAKALILTGYGFRLPVTNLRYPYLLKPVRRGELLDVVRHCLRAKA
jgi:two-component system response regulator PilR (NtrC family)